MGRYSEVGLAKSPSERHGSGFRWWIPQWKDPEKYFSIISFFPTMGGAGGGGSTVVPGCSSWGLSDTHIVHPICWTAVACQTDRTAAALAIRNISNILNMSQLVCYSTYYMYNYTPRLKTIVQNLASVKRLPGRHKRIFCLSWALAIFTKRPLKPKETASAQPGNTRQL